ncbi:hypothetical protein HYPSUDRAFT_320585 [Hypholoma sublateritium FD-334 SS-4]|uniref:F-box domain-containing protein n=1 Tax=Hypholoma sublateritium (strain FD-334 SS-4) TaxID=945553 RepID=A0A0D2Q485_HYPSF|nr:hypothetical protein HYPSUDRAFT_320585 [Hypholoma sublateritium FD-334 SS-4]
MQKSSPKLPLEVLGLIVDCLAYDTPDLSAIRKCALTCESMASLCRRHIFFSICLLYVADFHRFHNALQRSPTEIAMCVRHLKLSAVVVGLKSDTEAFVHFSNMVNSFTLLQSVEIYFVDTKVHWSVIQPEMRKIISRLIQSATLTSLTLRSIEDIPLSCFTGLGNRLRHLNLCQCSVKIANTNERPMNAPVKSVGGYSISQGNLVATNTLLDATTAAGTPIFNFGALKHLHIYAKFSDDSYTNTLYKLLGVAGQLSTLELEGKWLTDPGIYSTLT